MPIRDLGPADLEAEWPRLQPLLGGDTASRKQRITELVSHEGAYALLDEEPGSLTGLAVVEHYHGAWVFDDHVASIREWVAAGDDSARRLLEVIDRRARDAGMTHLQRFLTAEDESLAWWYSGGFVEYMTAFRKPIEAGSSGCEAADEISIRVVTDAAADWPKLWPLFEKLNIHHAALTGRPLQGGVKESSHRYLENELEGGDALVMLAEVDGEAIATSSAELGQPDPDGTLIGYRSRLYVEEPYRGRGLSLRFEERALPWFHEHGVTHVERWIVAGNERPRQIWTARGYKPSRLLLRRAL